MNVSRFQVALSNEEPEVVSQSLELFRLQILKESGTELGFGYNGRSLQSTSNSELTPTSHILHPPMVPQVSGLMEAFIRVSPQCEELFALWDLPARDNNKDLCANHMSCLAAILYCSSSNESFCNTIVTRIMSEYSKSIHQQLSSGQLHLVHSTIGLCISMARISPQICRDVYQRIVSTINVATLAILCQRGKAVLWEPTSSSSPQPSTSSSFIVPKKSERNEELEFENDESSGMEIIHNENGSKNAGDSNNVSRNRNKVNKNAIVKESLSTDARTLIIILLLLILEAADQTIASELLGQNTILRRITNTINKDSVSTARLTLQGLVWIQNNSNVFIHFKTALVDQTCQLKLLGMYKSDDEEMQELAHSFMLEFSQLLAKSSVGNSKSAISNRSNIMFLLKHLEAQTDLRHRDLLMIILNAQPSLLPKYIAGLPSQWEPIATFQYMCNIAHLVYVVSNVASDPHLKANLKATMRGEKSTSEMKSVITELLASMIPSTLTKKDFSKLIQHNNPLFQRLGLVLVVAVTRRIASYVAAGEDLQRRRGDAGEGGEFETVLSNALTKCIPDFVILSNLRGKFHKCAFHSTPLSEHDQDRRKTTIDDNSHDNICDTSDFVPTTMEGNNETRSKKAYLLTLTLHALENLVKITPTLVIRSGVDILKVIDDLVVWRTKESAQIASDHLFADVFGVDMSVVTSTFQLLDLATSHGVCRSWFGTRDEAVKLVTHIVLSSEWNSGPIKRSPFAKLMLLSKSLKLLSQKKRDYEKLAMTANELVKRILSRSEMRLHEMTSIDLELHEEYKAWDATAKIEDDSILLIDYIFRISYHWNTGYQILIEEMKAQGYADSFLRMFDTKVPSIYSTSLMPFEISNSLAAETSTATQQTYKRTSSIPFSCALVCALSLCSFNFNTISMYLPTHVRARVSNGIIDVDGSDSDAGLGKYDNGFRSSLLNLVFEVVFSTTMSSREHTSYLQIIVVTAKFLRGGGIAARKSIDFLNELELLLLLVSDTAKHTGDNIENRIVEAPTTAKNKKIKTHASAQSNQLSDRNTLRRAGAQYFHGTTEERVTLLKEDTEKAKSAIGKLLFNENMSLSRPRVLATLALNLDYAPIIPDIFDSLNISVDCWIFIVCLFLSSRRGSVASVDCCEIKVNTLQWIYDKAFALYSKEYDHRSSPCDGVLRSLMLLQALCSWIPSPPLSSNQHLASVPAHELMERTCSLLSTFILDRIKESQCCQPLMVALNTTTIQRCIRSKSHFGSKVRLLLCAASNSYEFVRNNRKSTIEESRTLWDMIATELTRDECIDNGNDNGAGKITAIKDDISLFSLGWLVQKIVKNPKLQKLFVNSALEDAESYALFDHTSVITKSLSIANRTINVSTAMIIESDDLQFSILSSASISRLNTVFQAYFDHERVRAGEARPCFNSLMGISFCTASDPSLQVSKTRITYYCDPLSIVDSKVLGSLWSSVSTTILSVTLRFVPLTSNFSVAASNLNISRCAFAATKMLPSFETFDCLIDNSGAIDTNWYVHGSEEKNDANLVLCNNKDLLTNILQENNRYDNDSSISQTNISEIKVFTSMLSFLSMDCFAGQPFVTNLLAMFLQVKDNKVSQYQLIGPFLYGGISRTLRIILSPTQQIKNVSDVRSKWATLFVHIISYFMESMSTSLSNMAAMTASGVNHHQPHEFPQVHEVERLCFLLGQFFEMKWTTEADSKAKSNLIGFLQSQNSNFRKNLNRWFKKSLKYGLQNTTVMNILRKIACNSFFTDNSVICSSIYVCEESDMYNPATALQMILGHSQFVASASIPSVNISILNTILGILTRIGSIHHDQATVMNEATDTFLVETLLSFYQGSMSEADRIIIRILHVLERAGRSPPLCTLRPSGLIHKNNHTSFSSSSPRFWITNAMSQSIVYSTLAHFPNWRCLIPQPLCSENSYCIDEHKSEVAALYDELFHEWGNSQASGKKSSSVVDDEIERNNFDPSLMDDSEKDFLDDGSGEETEGEEEDSCDDREEEEEEGEVDREWEGEEMEEDDSEGNVDYEEYDDVHHRGDLGAKDISEKLFGREEKFPQNTEVVSPSGPSLDDIPHPIDHLLFCSNDVYDPSYWIPALHYSLQQDENISVRQLANCGIISMTIATLGSTCPLLRTYALSCLNMIFLLIVKQNASKDAAFRERPQLLVLINFIKNAFEGPYALTSTSTNFSKIPAAMNIESDSRRLPSTVAITLGRAAMHLLQSGHEMYSKLNKYLLSRPFCDVKDIPLFDLLIIDGDAVTEESERLITLRLLRDGLSSRQDHLNFCRKNAYNRLMLLFPLLTKDPRAGHAVLDILDKGLGLSVAARYLLERCGIIAWLRQMASPMNSLHIDEGHMDDNDKGKSNGEESGEHMGRQSTIATTLSRPLVAAPLRLLSRVLSLLRRAIGANYLLSNNGFSSYLHQLFLIVTSLVDEVIAIDRQGRSHMIPGDFFRHLLLCMWDCSLSAPSSIEANSGDYSVIIAWEVGKIADMIKAVSNGFKKSTKESDPERDDLILSLTGLLAFPASTRSMGGHSLHLPSISYCIESIVSKTLRLPGTKVPRNNNPQKCESYQHYTVSSQSPHISITKMEGQYTNSNTSTSKGTKKIPYLNAVNILSQDTLRFSDEGKISLDLQQLFARSWSEWSSLDMEAASVPLADIRNESIVTSIMCKSILNCIINASCSVPDCVLGTQIATIELARWALVMKNIHARPPASFLTLQSMGSVGSSPNNSRMDSTRKNITNRLLSIIHGGADIDNFTGSYCDFTLVFRLTLVSLISAIVNPQLLTPFNAESNKVTSGFIETEISSRSSMQTALHSVFSTLVTGYFDSQIASVGDDDIDSLQSLFKQVHDSSPETFDGSNWWSKGETIRGYVYSLCLLSLDTIGALVSHFDRKDLHQFVELNPFLEKNSQLLFYHLCHLRPQNEALAYCRSSLRMHNGQVEEDSASENFAYSHCSFSDFGPTKNSLLFDHNPGMWRHERKHAVEGIASSIRLGNRGLL